MRTIFFDLSMGAAGDMLCAALLELCPDRAAVIAELNAIGIPGVSWMNGAPEPELIRVSRLCTCIAMVDSNLQENVQLILPESGMQEIPFEHLSAGMIGGEFASFAAYS